MRYALDTSVPWYLFYPLGYNPILLYLLLRLPLPELMAPPHPSPPPQHLTACVLLLPLLLLLPGARPSSLWPFLILWLKANPWFSSPHKHYVSFRNSLFCLRPPLLPQSSPPTPSSPGEGLNPVGGKPPQTRCWLGDTQCLQLWLLVCEPFK